MNENVPVINEMETINKGKEAINNWMGLEVYLNGRKNTYLSQGSEKEKTNNKAWPGSTEDTRGMSQIQASHNCRDLKASLCYRDPVSKLKTKLGM